ncbi:hypothetical protein [Pseudomonas aeruginosa]|uniref:hypothetical protein n=1 Tax=Pseudomonas aeruginosa TaxID=287 RepID=UPI000F546A25|nr:hypothetical protein [Pseudomonas aeruginosa]
MNDDLIRLSEFVPEHARHHRLDLQTAAYDLQELMEALSTSLFVRSGGSLPEHVCWVGGVTAHSRSSKHHMIDFESLSNYFETWARSPTGSEPSFQCFCRTESKYKAIPAGTVYFSRNAMVEWIQAAAVDCPEFLIQEDAERNARTADEVEAFKGKELVSIRGLTRGLIDIIVAVDKAHRGLPDKAKAAAILRAVSQLNPNEKTSKWHAALTELAGFAEVEDFRSNRKTLQKYLGNT